MYYIIASLVVGGFIAGSTLVAQPTQTNTVPRSSSITSSSYVASSVQTASPIVNNEALSAEGSLSF